MGLTKVIRSVQGGSDDSDNGADPSSADSGDMATVLGSPSARCETRGAKQSVNMVNHWFMSLSWDWCVNTIFRRMQYAKGRRLRTRKRTTRHFEEPEEEGIVNRNLGRQKFSIFQVQRGRQGGQRGMRSKKVQRHAWSQLSNLQFLGQPIST
jgi:hypothetical protein